MVYSPIIRPNEIGSVGHEFNLGTNSYDIDDLYSPDTNLGKAKLLDLTPPKYKPNPLYWFDKSKYGNHGSITGATWTALHSRATALKFNGGGAADDYVNIAHHADIENLFTGGGTFLALVNAASDGGASVGKVVFKQDNYIMTVSAESAGKMKISFYTWFTGADGNWITTNTELAINTNSLIGVTYDNGATTNDPIIYIDGVSKAITETGTPTEAWQGGNGSDMMIGNQPGQTRAWDNLIIKVLGINRILTATEITDIDRALKERYL